MSVAILAQCQGIPLRSNRQLNEASQIRKAMDHSLKSTVYHLVETSLATWRDFYNRNMNWNGKALYTCVMEFNKHNVVDTLNEEEASRFAVFRNKVQYYNNLGGALAVISRGPSKCKKYVGERVEP